MKGKFLVAISVIIGLAAFIAIAVSVKFDVVLQTLKLLSPWKFLVLFAFYMLLFTISLARWGISIKAFNGDISFLKLVSFRFSEWASGYVTPFSRLGGEPVMAFLLKKYGKLKYRKGIPVIVMNKMFDFAAGLMLAIIGMILLLTNYWNELTGKTIFILVAAVVILGYAIYKFYSKTIKKEGFFTSIIEPFKSLIPHRKFHQSIKLVEENLIVFFKQNKRKLIVMAIISLIFQILTLVLYKLIGLFIGLNFSLVHLLIINFFLILAFLVPTPGSLGGMEGAMAFAFIVLGFGGSVGFAFSIVLRAIEITLTVIGLLFAYYYGIKSFKNLVEEKF